MKLCPGGYDNLDECNRRFPREQEPCLSSECPYIEDACVGEVSVIINKGNVERCGEMQSNGLLYIPAEIQKALSLKSGDMLRFIYNNYELKIQKVNKGRN